MTRREDEAQPSAQPHSASDLQQLYRERFAGRSEYRDQVWKILISRFFARWIPPGASVLDLGCGYCEFINNVRARERFGMDLNPDASEAAVPDVTLIQHDCSKPWPIREQSLDIVFTSNFFEHLPSKRDLESTLRHAWRSLKAGGRLIALGPNIRYLPGAYWDFYDHYLPLTDLSLGEVMRKCDFKIERSIARFLPYTMSQGRQYPLWMLRVYLGLPAIWPVLGKQFLLVGQK